ncbi:MAG TPA: EamA family transporter [Solirubrobacteraceae bacterium]|nr:EamA family transporter [Solirubrobacteraceae bacterium]
MNSAHRTPLVSLAAAGVLSGLSVPLSKLALPWAGPAWLTVARFALATPVLAFAGRHGLRAALTPGVMAAGAVGFGLVVLLQSAGIARTSVSHASVVIGVVPVFVALIDASLRQSHTDALSWGGRLSPAAVRLPAEPALALGGIATSVEPEPAAMRVRELAVARVRERVRTGLARVRVAPEGRP